MATAPLTPTASGAPADDPLRSTYRKVGWRLMPFLLLCYFVAYLDRVNVGFAKLSMLSDLHFTETVYGLGAGIFFLGYFLFEVPSNLILLKVGPKVWIARIMITWGVISAAMVYTSSPQVFYVLRFLLGVAEAGFFPGIILYLTFWYPDSHRGRIVAWFLTAVALSGVFGNPLSGFIMHTFSGGTFSSWQWLFLLEGLPAVVLGILVLFYLEDSIEKAHWLSAAEKAALRARLERDAGGKGDMAVGMIFAQGSVWMFSAIYFFFVMGLYGVSFWLPTLIKSAGVNDVLTIGWLSAIPSAAAAVGMILIGRHSDRTGERHIHIVVCGILGAAGFLVSSAFPHNLLVALTGITVAMVAILTTISLSWTLPARRYVGTAAAAGIAVINSIGNLAGFVSPYMVGWIKDATGGLTLALYILAGCFIAGSGVVWMTRGLTPLPRS